jgi:hypothetical protein
MNRATGAIILGMLLAASTHVGITAQSAGIDKAYMGSWKLNVAKSKFVTSAPPKESTRTHDDRGSGFVIVTQDSVNAQGVRSRSAYTYKADGKPYPWAQLGATKLQTIALTAVDPFTVTFDVFQDGQLTAKGRRTLAKDGRTMTIESIDLQGKVGNVQFFDKQ